MQKELGVFFGGWVNGFLIAMILIGTAIPASAAQMNELTPTASLSCNVLSIVRVGDGDELIDNDFGLSYERAFNRWFSALGQVDYGRNDKYGVTIEDVGVQLEARVYPFGQAPSGFFGNLRVREFSTIVTGADPYGSLILIQRWWGLGLGYQWVLFKALALQAVLTFDDADGTYLQLPAGSFRYHDKFGIGWAF